MLTIVAGNNRFESKGFHGMYSGEYKWEQYAKFIISLKDGPGTKGENGATV